MPLQSHRESVHLILVNYNGLAWNTNCIDSVLQQTGVRPRIIFVDNASTDGSLEAAQHAYAGDKRVEFLPLGRNVLFAAGCNAGLERALSRDTEFIALLNNDTVMEPGCLAALCDFLRAHPGAAAVQPLLVRMDQPHRVASAGCRISRMGGAWDVANGAEVAALAQEPCEVPGVTAGAVLWRAEALRRVGFFDERFGMYFEDMDLSLRARKMGYSLHLLPGARVRHAVSATTNKEPSDFLAGFCYANALRLILKHWPSGWLATDCCVWFLVTSAAVLSALLRHGVTAAKGPARGLLTGLRFAPAGLWHRLRQLHPENATLRPWIDRTCPYPPRPEA